MKKLNECLIVLGKTMALGASGDGQLIGGLGSTHSWDIPLTEFVTATSEAVPHVIVTPQIQGMPSSPSSTNVAPLLTITGLTSSGFTVTATNMSDNAGSEGWLTIGFMAITEALRALSNVTVRMGITVPKRYETQGGQGPGGPGPGWQQTATTFARPLALDAAKASPILLTPTDPFGSFKPRTASVAGTAFPEQVIVPTSTYTQSEFQIDAMSVDLQAGCCAFNYLAAGLTVGVAGGPVHHALQ